MPVLLPYKALNPPTDSLKAFSCKTFRIFSLTKPTFFAALAQVV